MTARRHFLLACLAAGCAPWVRGESMARPHVLVVGGGFGGATAARFLREWSAGAVKVTLVERNRELVSCPLSNRVLSGDARLDSLRFGYGGLRHAGIDVLHQDVVALDPGARELRLADGRHLAGDRILLAPGIDFQWEAIPALADPDRRGQVLHAWKAGAQTLELARRIAALRDGGVLAISIPRPPFRCPPGPYERVSLIADYFRRRKPRCKLLVADANAEVIAKPDLFRQAWRELYPGIVEYLPEHGLEDIDLARGELRTQLGPLRADLLNVIPPQRAGDLALAAGMPLAGGAWVEIDWLTHEAKGLPGIHVIGDAVAAVPGMPKSAHLANQQAKRAAAAILDMLAGRSPQPAPLLANTCYSFVSADDAVHVAAMFRYSDATRRVEQVAGAGGLSVARSAHEGRLALDWARGLWHEALGPPGARRAKAGA